MSDYFSKKNLSKFKIQVELVANMKKKRSWRIINMQKKCGARNLNLKMEWLQFKNLIL